MSDPYFCEINLLSSLDWQRSGADIVRHFVQNEQDWMQVNHADFWNNWQKDVFNLGTANDFGLAVWSIILDEQLYSGSLRSEDDYPDFGFSSESENFFDGSFASSGVYRLDTDNARIILRLKAFKVLAMGGPIKQINTALSVIFGKDKLLAFDNLDMSFEYQIKDNNLIGIADEARERDLLPRPIGIEISSLRTVADVDSFGFAEDDENFFDGNFFDGTI